jgi:hypothetical protein
MISDGNLISILEISENNAIMPRYQHPRLSRLRPTISLFRTQILAESDIWNILPLTRIFNYNEYDYILSIQQFLLICSASALRQHAYPIFKDSKFLFIDRSVDRQGSNSR